MNLTTEPISLPAALHVNAPSNSIPGLVVTPPRWSFTPETVALTTSVALSSCHVAVA